QGGGHGTFVGGGSEVGGIGGAGGEAGGEGGWALFVSCQRSAAGRRVAAQCGLGAIVGGGVGKVEGVDGAMRWRGGPGLRGAKWAVPRLKVPRQGCQRSAGVFGADGDAAGVQRTPPPAPRGRGEQ